MASPALPGLLLCLIACILLVFTCVSAPVWDDIYFLKIKSGGTTVFKTGVFGYSQQGHKSGIHVGYVIPTQYLGVDNDGFAHGTLKALTGVMILHPIAAGFSGLAVIFGLCGSAYSRVGTIFMTLSAALAAVLTFVLFVIDMTLWGIAKHRIDHDSDGGYSASWGNAEWLTLGAFVALCLSFCLGICGSFGRYRHRERTTDRV